jgi:hypothetical protein
MYAIYLVRQGGSTLFKPKAWQRASIYFYLLLNFYFMLQTPLFKKFRVSEHIQFFSDVEKLCAQNAEAAKQVQSQLDAFTQSTQGVADTFKTERASEITEQLGELDAKRDQSIVCLRKLADAYATHLDENLQAAGKSLLHRIDRYGSRIYNMNYQAETSTLDNLGNDLTSDADLQQAVTAINADGLVQEMISLNNSFNSLYLNRVTQDTADQSISSGEAVKTAVADYRTLTEHMEAYSVISPSDANAKLLAELNTLIGQYNTMVEQRSGRNADEAEEETGTEVQ